MLLGSATPPLRDAVIGLVGFGFVVAATASSARIKGERELALLQKISGLLHNTSDLQSVLATALDDIVRLFGMAAGCLRVAPTPEQPALTVCRGLPAEAVTALEARAQGPEAGEAELPGAGALSRAFRRAGLASFVLYPIRAGAEVVGTMALAARKPGAISRAQEAVLRALAEILGVAVAHLRLRDAARKLSEDLIALQEVNKSISQSSNIEEITRRIVVDGKRLVKTSECHLFLVDDRAEALVGAASTHTDQTLDIKNVKIFLAEPAAAVTALLEKRVLTVEDLVREERSRKPVLVLIG